MGILRDSCNFLSQCSFYKIFRKSLAGFLFKLTRSSKRRKPQVALDFSVWPQCDLSLPCHRLNGLQHHIYIHNVVYSVPVLDQTRHYTRQRMGKRGHVCAPWISHRCKHCRRGGIPKRSWRNSLRLSRRPWDRIDERLLGNWLHGNRSLLFSEMEIKCLRGKNNILACIAIKW